MNLNELITEYQQTRDEHLFRVIYDNIHDKGRLVETFSRRYNLDEADVESMINEKLLNLVEVYDIKRGNFINVVYTSVKNGCIDLYRKDEREEEYRIDVMFENDDGEFNEVYEVIQVAPTTNETDILNEYTKNHDQRQLIANLLRNADDTVYETISAFHQTDSYRQAAKLIGTCHKTVKTRIRNLSRGFNIAKDGNQHDYFTMPTTYVG